MGDIQPDSRRREGAAPRPRRGGEGSAAAPGCRRAALAEACPNRLLRAFEPEDRRELAAQLERVQLDRGQVLFEPGEELGHV